MTNDELIKELTRSQAVAKEAYDKAYEEYEKFEKRVRDMGRNLYGPESSKVTDNYRYYQAISAILEQLRTCDADELYESLQAQLKEVSSSNDWRVMDPLKIQIRILEQNGVGKNNTPQNNGTSR